MLKIIKTMVGICSFLFFINLYASNPAPPTAVDKRIKKEDLVESNPFAITFFKQNYILPYYYTGSPYNQVYLHQLSHNEKIDNGEVKYQLSLKVPLWKNIFNSNSSLYFAYTQLSYWQAYNKNAFFRETDFQPDIFVTTQTNIPLLQRWKINTINIGAAHQSNGFGNELERSWNRLYIEAVTSTDNFMFSIKPWYVFHDSTYERFNPNMASYLGYGEMTIAYKFASQVLSLQTHSLIESGGRHATILASYSIPLTTYINAYVQVFSGYGQSLIEYNHHTNSIGIGIALNNLI